jgi:peroxiredoxin Q/BCP
MTKTAAKETIPTMPEMGVTAPNFTLPMDGGEDFSLAAQKGKFVVLYFYPKDDTPGCTVEAKEFRDLYSQFTKIGAEVCGLSKDNVKSHEKFKCKYELTFPLLADEEGTVCDAYGTWVEKSMYGKKYMGIQRATFLVNPQGKIAFIWPKVKVEGHAAEVLSKIQELSA